MSASCCSRGEAVSPARQEPAQAVRGHSAGDTGCRNESRRETQAVGAECDGRRPWCWATRPGGQQWGPQEARSPQGSVPFPSLEPGSSPHPPGRPSVLPHGPRHLPVTAPRSPLHAGLAFPRWEGAADRGTALWAASPARGFARGNIQLHEHRGPGAASGGPSA